jgi:ribonuclease P protein 1
MLFLSNLRRILCRNELNFTKNSQIIRCLRTDDDGQDETEDLPYPERRNHTNLREFLVKKQSHLSRKIFSTEQSVEERKICILTEMELLKEDGIRMPSMINDKHWELLLSEPNRVFKNLMLVSLFLFICLQIQKLKTFLLYSYLSKKESFKLGQQERKERIERTKELREDLSEDGPITNYPGHRSIIGHISGKNSYLMNYALSSFILNNPAIVFDFQFEDAVQNDAITRSLIFQLFQSYGRNIDSRNPFRMYFANLKKNGIFDKAMRARNIKLDDHCIVDTEKSYLDLFPREKLVYLSPDARDNMTQVDEDKVYIVGVLADRSSTHTKYTYLQAIKDKIKCERLPLEKYVR